MPQLPRRSGRFGLQKRYGHVSAVAGLSASLPVREILLLATVLPIYLLPSSGPGCARPFSLLRAPPGLSGRPHGPLAPRPELADPHDAQAGQLHLVRGVLLTVPPAPQLAALPGPFPPARGALAAVALPIRRDAGGAPFRARVSAALRPSGLRFASPCPAGAPLPRAPRDAAPRAGGPCRLPFRDGRLRRLRHCPRPPGRPSGPAGT
jgi:hypothetical protein